MVSNFGEYQPTLTDRLRAIPYELRVAILSAILLGEAIVYVAMRGAA